MTVDAPSRPPSTSGPSTEAREAGEAGRGRGEHRRPPNDGRTAGRGGPPSRPASTDAPSRARRGWPGQRGRADTTQHNKLATASQRSRRRKPNKGADARQPGPTAREASEQPQRARAGRLRQDDQTTTPDQAALPATRAGPETATPAPRRTTAQLARHPNQARPHGEGGQDKQRAAAEGNTLRALFVKPRFSERVKRRPARSVRRER